MPCLYVIKSCTTNMVDLANNEPNEETDDEAKEVLVFMLVGIQGCWKAPIAYFFTSTLSAATQKELVVHALEYTAEVSKRWHWRLMLILRMRQCVSSLAAALKLKVTFFRPGLCCLTANTGFMLSVLASEILFWTSEFVSFIPYSFMGIWLITLITVVHV